MAKCRDNLVQMGSTISATRFVTMIMASLPASYHSSIQTITITEKMTSITGLKKTMSPTNLMAFFVEEAQHCVINDEQSKAAESALLVHRKSNNSKTKRKTSNHKKQLDKICKNCKRKGHTKAECWAKGGDKERQGLKQNKSKTKEKKKESATIAQHAKADGEDTFVLTCTLVHVDPTMNL